MARLTRAQVASVSRALLSAEQARVFLTDPQTAVTRRASHATTTLHYTRPFDGAVLYEIDWHGSRLVLLDTAITELREFLAAGTQ